MYPVIRSLVALSRARRMDKLPLDGTDETVVRVSLADIDMFLELNNGRTLTLYDIGRFTLSVRVGLIPVLRRNRWGLAVAGVSVRYRARIRAFQKIRIRTRAIGRDDKFIYLEQAIWRGGTPCSHMLIRTAVTGPNGIVPTDRVLAEIGRDGDLPAMPDWARAWTGADIERPWPPDF
ncbi:thioeseterase [Rhodobacterales bacterium HKCCE3408]|nr:thioeseterase [Rhodobacterales bacterium HKCCE3408]